MERFFKGSPKKKDKVLEWIKALESGNYQQIEGELYGVDSRECCAIGLVGVLSKFKPKNPDCLAEVVDLTHYGLSTILEWNDDNGWDFPIIGSKLRETYRRETGITE